MNQIKSINPTNGEVLWSVNETSHEELKSVVSNAKKAQTIWESVSLEDKEKILKNFANYIQSHAEEAAMIITKENGKPLWESRTEVKSLVSKVPVVIDAYKERAQTKEKVLVNNRKSYTRYRPYGVMAVLGPFNFPMSMPNSHIMPALYAGNTVVFKPSERTILSARYYANAWKEAGLPENVLQIVYGDGNLGDALLDTDIDGALFIGSYSVGKQIEKKMAKKNRICVLEMGGNSPLVVWDYSDCRAAINIVIQSAYISSGQRCSSARRLIVNKEIYSEFVPRLQNAVKKIVVGNPLNEVDVPFMGPMIDRRAVDAFLKDYYSLIEKGAKELVPTNVIDGLGENFVRPAIIDTTNIPFEDKELFGPLLQLVVVEKFEDAIQESNKTSFGLAAGIITEDKTLYEQFYREVKAGIVNWNQQLTGATTINPFGGIKGSGNFHSAGYLSVDYCVYGCASIESEVATLPDTISPGLDF